ncbi:hypothetical protein [Ralstonia phage RP13]|nr:hypothetical protein [Ralstonia phage RP13]
MIENVSSKVLTGMGIIGDVVAPKELNDTTIQKMSMVLVGTYDEYLKCAAYYVQNKKNPETQEDLNHGMVEFVVNRVKNQIRSFFQAIFDQGAKEDQKKRDEILAKMKESNKPHAMGTVAEIAEKYGISKSEVRRMKAAGTLESLQLLGVDHA